MLASQVGKLSRWAGGSTTAAHLQRRKALNTPVAATEGQHNRANLSNVKPAFYTSSRGSGSGLSSTSTSAPQGVVSHGRVTEEEVPRIAKKLNWRESTETRPLGTFKVVSYNVMADSYTEPGPGRLTIAKPYVQGRLGLILKDLENLSADILCLQEVEADLAQHEFRPFLHARGYDMEYHVKARAKDNLMPESWKGRVDGLLMAWRTKKFNLLRMDNYELRELIFEHPNKWGVERKTLQSLLKLDNAVSVAILETTHVRTQRKQIAIANIHGHAGGENAKSCINVLQTQLALHACRKSMYTFLGNVPKKVSPEAPAPLPFIFAGDFNARPGSGSHTLLSSGFLPSSSDFLLYSQNKPSTTEDMKHYLGLQSAYGASIFGEPSATYYSSPMLNGVLDYIWYTPSYLSVHRLLEIPDFSLRKGLKLPTTEYPSDHLPIAAEFSFNPSITTSTPSEQAATTPKEEPVVYVQNEYQERWDEKKPRFVVQPAVEKKPVIGDDEFDHDTFADTPSKKAKGKKKPAKSAKPKKK